MFIIVICKTKIDLYIFIVYNKNKRNKEACFFYLLIKIINNLYGITVINVWKKRAFTFIFCERHMDVPIKTIFFKRIIGFMVGNLTFLIYHFDTVHIYIN